MDTKSFRVIRVVSAAALPDEQLNRIEAYFVKKFALDQYEVQTEIDPTLLGGFCVYLAGYRYDYSIKGQMEKLAEGLHQTRLEDHEDFQASLRQQAEALKQEPILEPSGFDAVEPVRVEEPISPHHLVDGLKEEVGNLETETIIDEVGEVLSVQDGIAYVSGLEHCVNDELLVFGPGAYGMAMNLEEDRIGVVLLGNPDQAREGTYCKRTGRRVEVPVGPELLGRVVDPLGQPLDGLGPIQSRKRRPIEQEAPGVIDRQPVNQPLYTGITAIDAMTPIGRGQRELIIGDRQTGKTAIAIDTIVNQRDTGVACIYVAIGQKLSTVARVVEALKREGALSYTTIVVASASDTAALQYIAPYAGCAMAEALMEEADQDVLIVYDDLTKHAQAYRALSLLLRRPPGREAFPGDVFYLHSRLLERAARLSEAKGGHSMTALPIVETQAGDISAYIPTNVISITDGQIYLESELFFSGQRPAINVGLSVSRVGGDAQTKAMKKVAGPLRMNLAQYRELQAFAQFGSDLDEATQKILTQGARLMEMLKQSQYRPRTLAEQVILLGLSTTGAFDTLDLDDVRPFCTSFLKFMHSLHSDLLKQIEQTGLYTDEQKQQTAQAFQDFLPQWEQELEADGATS